MAVLRLQNLSLPARDMERAAAFWSDVMGADLRFRDGGHWAQFSLAGQNLALAGSRETAPGQNGPAPVFEVDDLDAFSVTIEAGGGAGLETRDMGDHGRVVSCRDPEGNIFQLFQRPAGK